MRMQAGERPNDARYMVVAAGTVLKAIAMAYCGLMQIWGT